MGNSDTSPQLVTASSKLGTLLVCKYTSIYDDACTMDTFTDSEMEFSRVETDSQKYSYLAGKALLCPGVFVGHSVVSSTYLPVSECG